MSSAGWIFVGLLIVSPFYDAADIKDESQESMGRHRRSLMNLNAMVSSVTGRDGTQFLSYGNWCGLGGSGRPIDPIDECCQIHDFCYDLSTEGVCRNYGSKAVYKVQYNWRKTDEGTAACEEEEDKCKSAICMCDAIIANCLKNNIDSYNEENLKDVDLFDMLKNADFLTSR